MEEGRSEMTGSLITAVFLPIRNKTIRNDQIITVTKVMSKLVFVFERSMR